MRNHLYWLMFPALLTCFGAARAATYTVNYLADFADPNPGDGVCAGNGNANYCTLRAALQTANAHAGADTIVIPGGTYVLSLHGAGEDAAASGDLDISDSVTIQAQTAGILPTIDGDGADRIFDIVGSSGPISVTLFGLRLTHGVAGPTGIDVNEEGGAIRASAGIAPPSPDVAQINILYCIIDGNVATTGGGIYFDAADNVSMQYVLLRANQAKRLVLGSTDPDASAAYVMADDVSLFHTATVSNLPNDDPTVTSYALDITGWQNLKITDSTIAANRGPGLWASSSQQVYLNNISVLDNGDPNTPGGGLYVSTWSGYSSTLTLRNSIFAGNSAAGTSDCQFRESGTGTLTVDATGPNIDSDGTCQLQSSSGGMPNTSMAALRLAPLDYYGLLPSRPPMPGSVAIDTGSTATVNSGDPSCGAYDQNGTARPFDGEGNGNARCDIGAIEYHGDLIFVDGLEAQ